MLFTDSERAVVQWMVQLAYTNPFVPERVQLEAKLLGLEFVPLPSVLHRAAEFSSWEVQSNTIRLRELIFQYVELAFNRLDGGTTAAPDELGDYEDLVLFSLYLQIEEQFEQIVIDAEQAKRSTRRIECWKSFASEFERLFRVLGPDYVIPFRPEHMFACFFQVTRAFKHIFDHILGSSLHAARLRATVWESVFSCNLRRYSRWLYTNMGQVATLVTGPSGTGKELVARAIGISQYIPFDTQREIFIVDYDSAFYAVNLAALPATLIESELFGHRKGAFTGATADRVGWLEQCPPTGAVFLDEIGELDAALQVKLLRVLQTRKFQRLGETSDRSFHGKLIAATNRDLAEEMESGRFRQDLYYRLCADQITTPSLFEQLQECPDDLRHFVVHVTRRIFGEDSSDLKQFSVEVLEWIKHRLGPQYPWPGNIRELEQCIRNLLIHRNYSPSTIRRTTDDNGPLPEFLNAIARGQLTRDELLGRYFALVLTQANTLEQAATRLGVDRRTLNRQVDQQFLDQLRPDVDAE